MAPKYKLVFLVRFANLTERVHVILDMNPFIVKQGKYMYTYYKSSMGQMRTKPLFLIKITFHKSVCKLRIF